MSPLKIILLVVGVIVLFGLIQDLYYHRGTSQFWITALILIVLVLLILYLVGVPL